MNQPANASKTRPIADFCVLLVLAALVSFYLVDAIRASADILNLILILPLSIIVLALCAAQFILNLRRNRRASPRVEPVTAEPEPASEHQHVAPAIAIFAAYVSTLPWLGFDVGTCLFLASFLWLQGERRWPWLIGYSLGLALALTVFFSRMLPYPMPLLLLGSP